MRSIELPEFVVLYSVVWFFYILTLNKALRRCSAEARAIAPGWLWLMLIPYWNLYWHFVVVLRVTESLHNEFLRKKITAMPSYPGRGTGLAMCILSAAGVIVLAAMNITSGVLAKVEGGGIFLVFACLAVLALLAGSVCFIVFWVKISRCSRRVQLASVASVSPSPATPMVRPEPPRVDSRLYNLGLRCEKAGEHSEAVRWFRLAAEQGDANAQYKLAVMYSAGQRVRNDPTEALKWFRKAAQQGHADAQRMLAALQEATRTDSRTSAQELSVPSQPSVMEKWMPSSANVRSIVSLMGASTGTMSLRSSNHPLFRSTSSLAEGNIMCFVVLTKVVDTMERLNEAGNPREAILRAANLMDGVPGYEDVANAHRRFVQDYSADAQALLQYSRQARTQFLNENIPYHMRCAMTLEGCLS